MWRAVYAQSVSRARQDLGLRGERIAEKWLLLHGWKVLERRFRSGHRDIDLIVARQDGTGYMIAFVEVKARSSAQFGGPLGAVHWRKQRELYRSASVWLARHPRVGDAFRFDVIGVLISPGRVRIQHVENAFSVGRSVGGL